MRKFLIIVLIVFAQSSAKAQFGFLGDIAKVAVQTVVAPAQSVINAAKVVTGNGNVSSVYKPYVAVVNSTGGAISSSTQTISGVQQDLFQKAQQFVQQTTGNTGAFIFDLGTFTNQYCSQLAASSSQGVGAVLQGENVFEITAAPLAAAIRAGNSRYASVAMPIPNNIKQLLQPYFNPSVLANAKYAVGSTQITLPNFIGQGQALFGNDYAVTVDNIIVFNTDPQNRLEWWAHELTHVDQYQRWGIEKFAYYYLKDLGKSIETEAVNHAHQITNQTSSNTNLNSVSYDMAGSNGPAVTQVSNQSPEIFVAQCFFPTAPPTGFNYLVTNYGRLIAVNPQTGQWAHYGYATAPLLQGIAWTYQTQFLRYAVNSQGQILMSQPVYNNFGQQISERFVQVGEVHQL
jgi:hypothetical protein